jgi:hypothetical protein
MTFDLESHTIEEKATKTLALFGEDTPVMKLEEQSACILLYFFHNYENS